MGVYTYLSVRKSPHATYSYSNQLVKLLKVNLNVQ